MSSTIKYNAQYTFSKSIIPYVPPNFPLFKINTSINCVFRISLRFFKWSEKRLKIRKKGKDNTDNTVRRQKSLYYKLRLSGTIEIDDVPIPVRFSGSYPMDFRPPIRPWRLYSTGSVTTYFTFSSQKISVKRNDLTFLTIAVYISLIITPNQTYQGISTDCKHPPTPRACALALMRPARILSVTSTAEKCCRGFRHCGHVCVKEGGTSR